MTATTSEPRPLADRAAYNLCASVAFMAAPVGVLVGWAIMRLDARHGPGPGWTIAHAVWLVSYLLFGLIITGLYRRVQARRPWGRTVAVISGVLGMAGVVLIIGQMIVDLIVGLAASDQMQMHEKYQRALDIPGIQVLLYTVGPGLLIIGLAVLVIQLTTLRRFSSATAALAIVGIVLIAAEGAAEGAVRLLLMPTGVSCLWLALNAFRRRHLSDQASADH